MYIKLSRKYLDNLKSAYKLSDVKLPEYYDTEAYVELNESYFSKQSSDSIKKLNFAKNAIEKAIAISSSGYQHVKYFSTLNKILKRIEEVND